jgi:hypothetical protein
MPARQREAERWPRAIRLAHTAYGARRPMTDTRVGLTLRFVPLRGAHDRHRRHQEAPTLAGKALLLQAVAATLVFRGLRGLVPDGTLAVGLAGLVTGSEVHGCLEQLEGAPPVSRQPRAGQPDADSRLPERAGGSATGQLFTLMISYITDIRWIVE